MKWNPLFFKNFPGLMYITFIGVISSKGHTVSCYQLDISSAEVVHVMLHDSLLDELLFMQYSPQEKNGLHVSIPLPFG